MGLSVSLSLLVIVLLLTVMSAETSAAEQKWIRLDRGELHHLFYFIRRRIFLQRQKYRRALRGESAQPRQSESLPAIITVVTVIVRPY